jgi:redox-sensitive bicupin YhaK (pirin superfamily)
MSIRPIKSITAAQSAIEGAGVRLKRAFGFGKTDDFDPFLLFDDFRGDQPSDYQAGFPWHPHRGIETITYVLAGEVEHGDSLGNSGIISSGDIQWMTAGSGIIHQELPQGDSEGRMHGFQLWANLPTAHKMDNPRYQDIPAEAIEEVIDDDGTKARIISGELWGKKGPVDGVAADPNYFDISIPPNTRKRIKVEVSRHAFAYVFAGKGKFLSASSPRAVKMEKLDGAEDEYYYELAENRHLILFDSGDEIQVETEEEGIRFLLVSGRPLKEPVAWAGPIVMNTEAQLQEAYRELKDGTFLKHPKA